ncbi:MAG TPA: hypothetical protein VET23_10335, partial [Chitinophagaceae bacterium]|nr:hypothetical protein [Chitinophagaceae bacterium]
RLQNDQNTTHASYVLKNIQTPSIIPSEFIATSGSAAKISFHNIDHSPPPLLSGSETYLQNCVFRI